MRLFPRRPAPAPLPRLEADIAVGSLAKTPPSDLRAWVLITVDKRGYPKLTVRGCAHDHVQMLAAASDELSRQASAHVHGGAS